MIAVIDWRERKRKVGNITSKLCRSKSEVEDCGAVGWPQSTPERALEPTHKIHMVASLRR